MNQIPDFLIKKDSIISLRKENLPYGKEYYSEVFLDKEKIIFEKRFKNNNLYETCYYAYNANELSNILENENNGFVIFEFYEKDYKIIEYKNYKAGIEINKDVFVENSKGECICLKKYKLDNTELTEINTQTEKKYYENDSLKYMFEYNKDGTCFMINNYDDLMDDIFAWELDKPNSKLNWIDFEYYRTVNPLIPEK